MNIKTKKLAREFLYFLGSIIIIALIYCILFFYDYYLNSKIIKNDKDYTILKNQKNSFLARPLNVKNHELTQEKLDYFVNYILTNPNLSDEKAFEIIPELNNDTIILKALADYAATIESNKYLNKKELNLKFPELFVINTSDKDSFVIYQHQIKLLLDKQNHIKELKKSVVERKKQIYNFALLIFIISFGFRYIIYATKWSYKEIKRQD
jgi:Ca2+/Na+ antiporter